MPEGNPYAALGSADFLAAIQGLLPRGMAWPRDPDAVLTLFWSAVADEVAALHARIGDLSEREADPRLAAELLSDWEACFGLPDPCTPSGQSLQQRRAALVARITGIGGQSIPYLTAQAAAAGYAITITEFRPARIGQATIGSPLNGQQWIFAFQVNAAAVTTVPSRIGLSAIGDPLVAWGNTELECLINRLAPAHSTVIFAFGG